MYMDIKNLFVSPAPPGPIVPVHELLRAGLIIALFILTLLACSVCYFFSLLISSLFFHCQKFNMISKNCDIWLNKE
ncbi:unnamed protein product [Wuchereria bancrofti]|uniref:Uncharacterized protein n=1 Tax=Wuchereria bancrofti TaxID=6293 RepID=A0A3P7GHF4_WUCBA|nr:unnamed protein product [Wuchereria bancrofti]